MILSRGVYQAKKKNGDIYFRVSFTYKGRHISLGSTDNLKTAAMIYEEASSLKDSDDGVLDFPSYDFISFEKYLAIVNFRDNGVYFHNPIYLHQRYFSYFLDKDTELKFDTDDLFFYSQHKIQRRGGHLFVENYGAQMTVESRYGIHPFAVAGRDYRFMNGDPLDFRYENIEIINRYLGVEVIENTIPRKFRSYIHVNGYYNLGVFSSETKAAIAFNKARSLLRDKGRNKDTPANYIADMPEDEYREAYDSISLPPSFLKMLENL